MMVHRYIPSSALAGLVKCFWYSEGAPKTHGKERLMPNGEPTIVVNLCDEEMRIYDAEDLNRFSSYKHALISGARTKCFVIDAGQEDRVFGIQFWAGGAFPFFREPALEMANESTELSSLWKSAAGELRERLLAVRDFRQMFRVAELFLLAETVRSLELHPAVRFAQERFARQAGVSVAAVANEIGLSQRRFIQLFEQQIGLTPKAFSRVRRFQNILQRVHGARTIEWAQLALEWGYYDQAHFIHDFREFAGMTPTQYMARVTEHLNHVPLP
jgi:AraC-like DNA-binding protein